MTVHVAFFPLADVSLFILARTVFFCPFNLAEAMHNSMFEGTVIPADLDTRIGI